MDSVERLALLQIETQVPFTPSDAELVANSIAPKPSAMLPHSGRRPMQHFTSGLEYLSEDEWSLLPPLIVRSSVAMDLLCKKVIDLGGRTLSEN